MRDTYKNTAKKAGEKMKMRQVSAKAFRRFAGVLIVLTLLFVEVWPLAMARSEVVGTPGNDSLRGLLYDFELNGDEDETYTDPGGNDRLSSAAIKNTGYGEGRATFVKDSGSYTLNGVLTLSNITFVCLDLRLSARAFLSLDGLLAGSSVNLTSIAGKLPRVIAKGAKESDVGIFGVPAGVILSYKDGEIYASSSPLIFFNGNGATRAPAPAVMAASSSGVLSRLPRAPRRAEYKFIGWNTAADGGGEAFSNKTLITSSMTVYAQWESTKKTSEPPAEPAPVIEKRAPEPEAARPGPSGGADVVAAAEDDPSLLVREDIPGGGGAEITSLDLGSVMIGTSAVISKTIVVEASNLNIADPIEFDIDLAGKENGFSVATSTPWSNYSGGRLSVSFDESVKNAEWPNYTGSLIVTSGDLSTTVSLRAAISAPFIRPTPTELEFGQVQIGTTKTLQVEVAALLRGTLTYQLVTGDNSLFRVTPATGWSASTGGVLNVVFTDPPNPEQEVSTILRISSSLDGITIDIPITGESVYSPYLDILDPLSMELYFSASVGGGSQIKTVSVMSGRLNSPIVVERIGGIIGNEMNDYTVDRTALDNYNNQNGIIQITFRPGAEGERNCVLRIRTVDSEFVRDVYLYGTGRPEQEIAEIVVSRPSISFGTVYIGPPTTPVVLTVTGNYLTQSIQVEILNDDEANFSFMKQAFNWNDLNGGVIEVSFNPKSIGYKSATLRFYTDDGYAAIVYLDGQGAAAIPPTIINQNYKPEVFAGETASFSISATGTPPPTYQWYQSPDNGASWVAIAGATTAVYSLSPATATHNEMSYQCEVTNGFGTVYSTVMHLTVLFPSLTVSDSSGIQVRRLDFGEVDPGEIETKMLTVFVINLMVGRNVTHVISGADASAFTCVRQMPWTNSGGGLIIEFKPNVSGKVFNAVLTVRTEYAESVVIDLVGSSFPPPPPSFIKNPVSQLRVSGETAEFTVALATETARYTLGWQKKGTRAGDDWMDIQGASGTLMRTPAIISESGAQYRCVAYYKEGQQDLSVTSSIATLSVVSPVIRASVRSLGFGRVVAGERESISLKVSGTYLTKDIDIKIGGADAASFAFTKGDDWHGVNGGTLVIDFKPSAIGKNYSAMVTLSSAGADNVIVDVYGTGSQLPPPRFLSDPSDVVCDEGDDVSFSVTMQSGTLDYKLKWQKKAVGSDEWTDISGASRTTLDLRNVPVSDNGTLYRCLAVYVDDSSSQSKTSKSTAASDTVIESGAAKLTVYYRAIENPAVIRGLGFSATFRFGGDLAKVKSVRFNGEFLALDNSKVQIVGLRKDGVEIGQMSSGSVVITFHSEFVDTLADGRYPVLVTFEDDSIHRGLLIVARAVGGGPYTGDDTESMPWFALMAFSASGMGVTYAVKKNPRNKKKKK